MRDARPAASSAPALARAVDCVFLWPGYLAGVLYFVLAFFVTYDVLARKWGAAVGLPTTRVTDEISGYLLALAATWGFAFTLRGRRRTCAWMCCSPMWPRDERRRWTAGPDAPGRIRRA